MCQRPASQDCDKRKEFAEKGRSFLNSLIEEYNSEILPTFNRASKTKDNKSKILKETKNLECVKDPSTRVITLEWK